MIKTSSIADSIQLSHVRSLFNEAKQYTDVIDFTLGDPDIQTHQEIKMAACDAIMSGKTRYSQNAGLLELRETISAYYSRKEKLNYSPQDEIIATVGAMEGLYLALLSILDPGDEVIIPAPFYVNYVQMIKLCHAVPVIVEPGNDRELRIDIKKVSEAITPRTKAIIINTPSNPTGRIISQEAIAAIAELSIKHNLVVLSDEVYKCLIYDNAPFLSIASLKGMRERTILINSLSKEFCMTGYRIGYVLGPKEVIGAMTKLQENVAACAPLPSQYAAIRALGGASNYSENMVGTFTDRMNTLYAGLSNIAGITPIKPDATFYMMVDISKTNMNSLDFCYALLRKAHVATVPGITYGQCCDKYIRIAFTLEKDKISEGVKRIESFIKSLQ